MLIDFNLVDLVFYEKVVEIFKVKLNYMVVKYFYYIMFIYNLI